MTRFRSFVRVLLVLMCFGAGVCGCGPTMTKEDKLVDAVRRSDIQQMVKLLAAGAKIDDRESRMLRQTPLVASAIVDNTNAFFFLLSNGANVNAPAHEGVTPLMQAVLLGDSNLPRINALIVAGANVNATNEKGHSVLAQAKAVPGSDATIKALIEAGAKEK